MFLKLFIGAHLIVLSYGQALSTQPCPSVAFAMDNKIFDPQYNQAAPGPQGLPCGTNCGIEYLGYGEYVDTAASPCSYKTGYSTFWKPETGVKFLGNITIALGFAYAPNQTTGLISCPNMCIIDESGNQWVNANPPSNFFVDFFPYCDNECHMYAVVYVGAIKNLNTSATITSSQMVSNLNTPFGTSSPFLKVFGGSCHEGCGSIVYPKGTQKYTPCP